MATPILKSGRFSLNPIEHRMDIQVLLLGIERVIQNERERLTAISANDVREEDTQDELNKRLASLLINMEEIFPKADYCGTAAPGGLFSSAGQFLYTELKSILAEDRASIRRDRSDDSILLDAIERLRLIYGQLDNLFARLKKLNEIEDGLSKDRRGGDTYRAALESAGFPVPFVKGDQYVSPNYDEPPIRLLLEGGGLGWGWKLEPAVKGYNDDNLPDPIGDASHMDR